MKKAFTLIELLVVIAIIAILAAILFPVFAQAKAAAKNAASISNAKQHGLALVMYAGDVDDTAPPATSWNPQDSPGNFPFGFGDGWAGMWSFLDLPYIKNGDIYYDPLAPSTPNYAGDTTLNATEYPNYGYNYVYLSPWDGTHQTPVSMTAAAKPAETVMLASKWAVSETNLNGQFLGFQFNYASDGPLLNGTVEVPECNSIPQACATNWGQGGFVTANSVVAGSDTGGVALRHANMAVVAWLDGHVKSMSPGALAAGTNWDPTIAAGNVVFNPNYLDVYLWDLQ